jgi:succinate dehydrogenase/fumarate reductase flavoprotein subunit
MNANLNEIITEVKLKPYVIIIGSGAAGYTAAIRT